MVIEGKKPERVKWNDESLWARCLQWLQWLQSSGKSPSTIYHYGKSMETFCLWINERTITPERITEFNLYLLNERKFSPAHVTQAMMILGCFFGWLERKRIIESNPFTAADRVHVEPTLCREVFTPEEYAKLKEAAISKPNFYYLTVCLYNTGMRIGDAIQLKWESVSLKDQVINLIPQKTRKKNNTATIPLLSGNDITKWLIQKNEIRDPRNPYVADIIDPGSPYSDSDVQGAIGDFNRWMKACGIKKKAHSFRRTFITGLLSGGVDSRLTMQIAGIVKHDTLRHYFAPSVDALRTAMTKSLTSQAA